MKKISIALLLFFGFCRLLQAQTNVVVLGTNHVSSTRFNPDSILNVLNKYKPDVILMELDTSLIDDQGNFKGKAITIQENEEIAAREYKHLNRNVQLRGFDIEYRNHYYDTHKTFANEAMMDKAIDSLNKHGGLDRESMQIISALHTATTTLDILSDMGISMVNSKQYRQLAQFKQYWMYQKQLEIIARVPKLKAFYDFYKDDATFWDVRNKKMIANIAHYAKLFIGKKIIVLTGSMHTYYLLNGLQPLQSQYNFKLLEPPLGN